MAENPLPIVIIDDEPGVGMIFTKILSPQGHPIHHFGSVEDALPFLEKSPAIEIVFLDIVLPGMDGITALPKLLRVSPAARIVMMTAYQTVESVVKAMKSGALDYLVKPLNPQMVLQALSKYGASSSGPVLGKVPPRPGESRRVETAPPAMPEFMAHTAPMKAVVSVADKFASSEENVLILGESGTGKELLACHIHKRSQRRGKPFIVVDCASIPESLFESELFGYEKGAFTGAEATKTGRFEMADGGTLFLDEIGNVPSALQAKLLRFTQDQTITRLGGKKPIALDVRLIAATNADLQKMAQKGAFREDLYYRISSLTLHLPPLRNRPNEEKEFLVRHFLEEQSRRLKRPVPRLSETALRLIAEYHWPGNIRELENALHSALLLCDSDVLDLAHFPIGIQSYFNYKESAALSATVSKETTLREILKKVEREQILSALKQTGGNKKKASEILDMDYKNFLNKLKEYGPDAAAAGGEE